MCLCGLEASCGNDRLGGNSDTSDQVARPGPPDSRSMHPGVLSCLWLLVAGPESPHAGFWIGGSGPGSARHPVTRVNFFYRRALGWHVLGFLLGSCKSERAV